MRLLRPLAVTLLLLLPACGSSDAPKQATVLAAASLTDAFTDIGGARFSFAGSHALATQIQQGAPADVFASADMKTMQVLVDAGLLETPQVFAHNCLTIAVAPGNPKHITGLADLAAAGLVVVLADPSVPAGNYAQQALTKAGVRVQARSLELDVRSALTKVTSGEADATIAYVTDVRSVGDRADAVAIPDDENVEATYPIAIVRDGPHPAAAKAFVAGVLSERGQRILRRHGFLPA